LPANNSLVAKDGSSLRVVGIVLDAQPRFNALHDLAAMMERPSKELAL
jgi:hypothetical protein